MEQKIENHQILFCEIFNKLSFLIKNKGEIYDNDAIESYMYFLIVADKFYILPKEYLFKAFKFFLKRKDYEKLKYISILLNKYYNNFTEIYFYQALNDEKFEENEILKNFYTKNEISNQLEFKQDNLTDVEKIGAAFRRVGATQPKEKDKFFHNAHDVYLDIAKTAIY